MDKEVVATFKQRYGISFENYVRSLLPEDMTLYSNMDSNENYSKMFSPFKVQEILLKMVL